MPIHSKFFTILFADDTTFQVSPKNLDYLTECANKYLKEISSWFTCNRLTLNAKKTKCMLFGPNGQSPPLPNKLTILGTEIERIGYRFLTKNFKLVGVLLDDNLDWKEHARHVKNKVAKANYCLARAKKCLPKHIKFMVYNSLIKCHLEYCLPIWGNCGSQSQKSLMSLQKSAIRNIQSARYNSHTDPIYKKLKILKLNDLYTLNVGIFMFKITMGNQPKIICNIFKQGEHFSRNLNFIQSSSKFNYIQKLVPNSLVKVWNQLHRGHRDWIKELPKSKKKPGVSDSVTLPDGCDRVINSYRLNGFKKSLLDTLLDTYKERVLCSNTYCSDCN